MRKGQLSVPSPPPSAGATRSSSAGTTRPFARGWGQIDNQLQAWSLTSGLWDPLADRRKTGVRGPRRLAMLAGSGPRVLRRVRGEPVGPRGGSSSSSPARCWAVAGSPRCCGLGAPRAHAVRVGAVAARGVVPALPPRVRDLPRRGGRQARRAARVHGVGGGLDEIDRWERAVAGSTTIPQDAGLGYVHMAPMLDELHRVGVHRPLVERQWRRGRLGRWRGRGRGRRQLVRLPSRAAEALGQRGRARRRRSWRTAPAGPPPPGRARSGHRRRRSTFRPARTAGAERLEHGGRRRRDDRRRQHREQPHDVDHGAEDHRRRVGSAFTTFHGSLCSQ